MTVFVVTDPESGRKVRLTGDSPPTDAELEQIFADLAPKTGLLQRVGKEIVGAVETVAAMGSSILAEPLAGVAGLTSLLPQIPPREVTASFRPDTRDPGQVVEETREQLTFQPRTEAGQRDIKAVGAAIAPVGKALGAAEEALGTGALELATELGASPQIAATVGAIAKTIPTALLEVSGFAAAKGVSKLKTGKELQKAITESAPTSEQLKSAARVVFNEIDGLGATIKPVAFDNLTRKIEKAARNVGASPRTTSAAFGVIDDFKDVKARLDAGEVIGLNELMELRTVANNAAKAIDPAQKAPALAIIDEIDNFLDSSGTSVLNVPKDAPNIGAEYRAARQTWGRARRSELLDEAFVKAKDTASGFENGLRIEFRKILKNRRQGKFFSAKEKTVMRQVSEGTTGSNIAKTIGRLGFSEGQAINIINPFVGGAAGAALFGTPGAIAVPLIGQVSKQLAQRLTRSNAAFADQVVRAGGNAEQITKAYLKNTPKGRRSSLELSELLIRNDVDLTTAKSALAKDAADLARQFRVGLTGAAVSGAATN